MKRPRRGATIRIELRELRSKWFDINEGRARIADHDRLRQATLLEQMVPGRRFVCGFDYRTGFGAVACERKLWITGLNEARLQLYGTRGREVTLHVLHREGSNMHAWDAL